MRWLALLVLFSLAASADDKRGRFERFCSRGAGGRSDRGFLCDDYAFFEAFPASGAGTTTACSATAPTGAKGEALTFTRAGSAWCTRDDYSLSLLSSNQLRVMSGTGGTTPLGAFVEPAGQNDIVNNRDLSQAQFTKVSMSCTKTATGVDGVASSASVCTASGANGTVLQAAVIVAATRNSSLYIKRRTGTGAIEVTRDNGATWSAITSSLSSSIFKRVVSAEAIGCAYGGCIVVPAMTSGVANPTVGVRIVTSGDAVDIDLVQDETTAYPSSPIATAGAAATRAADGIPSFATPSFAPLSLSYTVMLTATGAGTASGVEHFNSGSSFFLSNLAAWTAGRGTYTQCYPYSGSGSPGTTAVYIPTLGPTPVSCSLSSGANTTTTVLGVSSVTATTATAQAFTSVRVGNGVYGPGGVIISQVCSDPIAARCVSGRTHPTAIAWVGDSITQGDAASPSRPPAVLGSTLNSRTVYNLGINGAPTSTCLTNARAAIAARARTLVLLCGVNSLAAGAAAVWADLQTALSEAKAAGMTVIPVKMTPWASAGTWSAGLQSAQDSVNSSMQSWCTANGVTCVDTSSLGSGSPASLLPGYDSGDGLHLNAAGGIALATLVNAAAP